MTYAEAREQVDKLERLLRGGREGYSTAHADSYVLGYVLSMLTNICTVSPLAEQYVRDTVRDLEVRAARRALPQELEAQ